MFWLKGDVINLIRHHRRGGQVCAAATSVRVCVSLIKLRQLNVFIWKALLFFFLTFDRIETKLVPMQRDTVWPVGGGGRWCFGIARSASHRIA